MDIPENEDGILGGAAELSVKLPVFEGPLDLLLFLLRKNEIDIYDIPIGQITGQYLSVLRAMERLSLDIAGEFFVMAATLMYIKSRMLLPADERPGQEGEEEEAGADPRWELVGQLLEYKKVKQGAMALEDMIEERLSCIPRSCSLSDSAEVRRPLKNSDRIELWNTFNNVLRRLAEKLVEGEITGEQVSVSDRMEFILSLEGEEFSFSGLFEKGRTTVPLLVATFLAVLELTRLRRLDISQDEAFGEIYLKKLPEPSAEHSRDSGVAGGGFDGGREDGSQPDGAPDAGDASAAPDSVDGHGGAPDSGGRDF